MTMSQPHSSHASRGCSLELPFLLTEAELLLDTLDTPSEEVVSSFSSSSIPNPSRPITVPHNAADTHARAPDSSSTTVMPAKAMVPVLVGMMLLTGCCNTLLTKYQVRHASTIVMERLC